LDGLPPFDERIDLVLARGGFRALRAGIVGEDAVADRTLRTLPLGPRGRRGDASPGALRPSA